MSSSSSSVREPASSMSMASASPSLSPPVLTVSPPVLMRLALWNRDDTWAELSVASRLLSLREASPPQLRKPSMFQASSRGLNLGFRACGFAA